MQDSDFFWFLLLTGHFSTDHTATYPVTYTIGFLYTQIQVFGCFHTHYTLGDRVQLSEGLHGMLKTGEGNRRGVSSEAGVERKENDAGSAGAVASERPKGAFSFGWQQYRWRHSMSLRAT